MKLSGITLVLFSVAPLVFGQAQTCTQEMIASDDCAAVIDANACYNEYRWNAQTLQCIDGKDNTDRQRKACLCCSCVGTVMCNWVKSQRFSCATN